MSGPLATLPPLPRLALRLLPARQRVGVRAVLEFHGAVGGGLRTAFPSGSEAMQAANGTLQSELAPGSPPPRTPGLADALAAGVPRRHLVSIVDGWNAYLLRRRPRDRTQFENTLRLLAGAPARAVAGVLALDGTGPGGPAESLGMGIGMTRMLVLLELGLRDGRLHLPEEDAGRFGANLQDLADGRRTKAVQDLLWFQARRARELLAAGDALSAEGPAARYLAVHRAWARELLDRMEKDGFDVFGRSVELGPLEAVRLLVRHR